MAELFGFRSKKILFPLRILLEKRLDLNRKMYVTFIVKRITNYYLKQKK